MTLLRKLLLLAFLVPALVLAGCGDDDDDDITLGGANTDDESSDDESSDDESSDDESSDDESSDEEDTSDDEDSDDGGGSGEGVCSATDAVDAFVDQDNNNEDIPSDETLELLNDIIGDLSDADNGDLADQLEVMSDGLGDVEELVDEAAGDVETFNTLLFEWENFEAFATAADDVRVYLEEECGVGFDDDVPEDFSDFSDDFDTDGGSSGDIGDPQPPPDTDNPEFAALAEECFDGSGSACDELYSITPVDSPEEAYGDTCGGRFAESQPSCAAAIGG